MIFSSRSSCQISITRNAGSPPDLSPTRPPATASGSAIFLSGLIWRNPTVATIKPIFLLADSQLLYWRDEEG
jgi:hypothetical protein